MTTITKPARRRGFIGILVLASIAVLQGCSLLSVKLPEKPLPPRDLNARLLTREYADYFQKTIARTADEIAARSSDPAVQLAALQWKVHASSASRRAATQLAPMLGLLDTWALSAQMQEFLTGGAGSALFGDAQESARTTVGKLEDDIVEIAHEVTSREEFTRYQKFVNDYVRDAPLAGIEFVRASVVDRWSAQTGEQTTLLSTVGTAAEVVSDFSDRVRMYGDQLPTESMWQAQVMLRQAGYAAGDWQRAMNKMNDSLSDIGRLADASPDLLRGSITDLRGIMYSTASRFDRSWMQMLQAMDAERDALAQNIERERLSVIGAVDVQRAAVTKDAERIANELTEASWRHLRELLRELVFYALAALIIVLGGPFAAGYFVGRARERRAS